MSTIREWGGFTADGWVAGWASRRAYSRRVEWRLTLKECNQDLEDNYYLEVVANMATFGKLENDSE